MNVLVVSDTHKKNENYFRVLKKVKPDRVIHCGDIEGSENILLEKTDCLLEMVAGNNDYFSVLPMEREFGIGNYKIWVTHGHNYYVSMGTERLKQEARARGVNIVLCGHTHRPKIDLSDDVMVVNPGSISYPRQDGRKPSYVLMDFDRFGEVHFTIRYL